MSFGSLNDLNFDFDSATGIDSTVNDRYNTSNSEDFDPFAPKKQRDYTDEIIKDQKKLINYIIKDAEPSALSDITAETTIDSLYNDNSDFFRIPLVYGGKLSCEDSSLSRSWSKLFLTSPLCRLVKRINKDRNQSYVFGGQYIVRGGLVVITTMPDFVDKLDFYSVITLNDSKIVLTNLHTYIAGLNVLFRSSMLHA